MSEAYWIDTHCHMNEELYRDRLDEYMKRAWDWGVRKNIFICCDRQALEYSFRLKERYPYIELAFGYHPEDVDRITTGDIETLRTIAADPRILAIGEVGLDYYWRKDNAAAQQRLFILQIELANELNKPLLIHTRAASRDTFNLLKTYAHTNVLMHCFGESAELMREYLKLGYSMAFGGVVTFHNAKTPRENALSIPLDRLMIETDCPYMTPEPLRGKTNETAFVRYVGEFIAAQRGIPAQTLQRQLMDNYERFFHGQAKDQ